MHYSEEIDFSNRQETPIATVILGLVWGWKTSMHLHYSGGSDYDAQNWSTSPCSQMQMCQGPIDTLGPSTLEIFHSISTTFSIPFCEARVNRKDASALFFIIHLFWHLCFIGKFLTRSTAVWFLMPFLWRSCG